MPCAPTALVGYDQYGNPLYQLENVDPSSQAGGDRTKAAALAKQANKRRKMKRGGSGTMGSGFPFDRKPSPMREQILRTIQQSQGTGR